MTDDDRIVADYLRRLRRAVRGLPGARRRELIDEIRAHIAEARLGGEGAPGDGSPGEMSSSDVSPGGPVRAILGRLGDPADIVRAAGGPAMASHPGGLEIAAVILLLIGGILAGIGWVVGVILLWISPRWHWTDKLLGTLVWPGGLVGILILSGAAALQISYSCSSAPGLPTTCTTPAGPPAWVFPLLLALVLAAQVLVTIRLLRRAKRIPEPEPVAAQPSLG